MTVKDIMTLLESPDRVRVIKDGEGDNLEILEEA